MPIWPLRPYASVPVRKVLVSVVLVSVRVLKIKRRFTSSQFELREVRALRQTPSRSLEDLESDHAQRQTQLTPESHQSMNNYYTSITKALPELEPRLSRYKSVLWETSVPVKHLIKKASPALLNFTKSTGSRAENVRKFSLCARIRLHDYFRTAEGNKGEGSVWYVPGVFRIKCYIFL